MIESDYTYLAHHGVKGMKWGVRRDRDKTGRSRKSRSEEQNGSSERKGLSDKQKKVLKGVAIGAGALVAAYGAYKLHDVYKDKKSINIGKHLAGDIPESLMENGLKKLPKKESFEQVLKNTNPLKGSPEGKNNCSYSAIAGFIRSLGYDVRAGSTGGKPQNLNGLVEEMFEGARTIDGSAKTFGKSQKDAADFLLKRFKGENSEGAVSVDWRGGMGGHVFSWKIENGSVRFFDNQQGSSDVSNYWNMIDPNGSLQVARLDNAKPKWDKLKKIFL